MRIGARLLPREQPELIRDARARLAARRPVESRDSAVLPGVRWELIADMEKGTVATRLAGAPEWIVKRVVTGDDFWVLPLDGSVASQFPPASAHGKPLISLESAGDEIIHLKRASSRAILRCG